MQALNIAILIFCFVLAGGIVNSSGIFDTIQTPNVEMPSANLASGISEQNVSSSSDVESAFSGSKLLISGIGSILVLFEVLTIPYYYLFDLGVPNSICYAVQTIVTLSEICGLLFLYLNRSPDVIP